MKKAGRWNRRTIERIIGIAAIAGIAIAWVIGYMRTGASAEPLLGQALPSASRFEHLDGITYAAYTEGNETPVAYVAIGQADGYGGPMRVAVAIDLEGNVLGMAVIEHKETPAWYVRVMKSGLVKTLLGKNYQDAFRLEEDIDGVTGATYTSRAIAESVLNASRSVARTQLGFRVPPESPPALQFGGPEIAIIALFAVGYFGHKPKTKYKKYIRWGSMLAGMVILGFVYNSPLTIAYFNQLLLGYWPAWQTHLYWYLLIGGILFVFTVDNKNPYCEWFCPFGSAQECMGALGGAKVRSAGKYKDFLTWLQRGLAWLAIVLALIYRNPGLSSYEVFGTLFNITGSTWQFALLGIILIASLFLHRPWCSYLCPLRPVVDLYRTLRSWILETWTTLRKPRSA